MKKIIYFLFLAFFIISCSSDTKSKKTPKTQTKAVTKKGKATKNVKNLKNDYWSALKAELNLTTKQIRQVKSIESQIKKETQVLRAAKKLTNPKKKELKRSKKRQITQVIGKKMSEQKIKFDEKWNK